MRRELLFALIFIVLCEAVDAALPAQSSSDYVVMMRNNNNTYLMNININVTIDVKPEPSYIMNYLTYSKNFTGIFTLHNPGLTEEYVIIGYPTKSPCLDRNLIPNPADKYLRNFQVSANGENLLYDCVSVDPRSGICGELRNGSSVCESEAQYNTCSLSEGPFIRTNDCKTFHAIDGSMAGPGNYCTGENPCADNCTQITYCKYLNGSYTCNCSDSYGKANFDQDSRYICPSMCFRKQCNDTECASCTDPECILPYGKNLIGLSIRKFSIRMLPKSEMDIIIKYDVDYAEANVMFNYFDEYANKPLNGILNYRVSGAALNTQSGDQALRFGYNRRISHIKPVEHHDSNYNYYTWTLNDSDSTMNSSTEIFIPLTKGNNLISSIKYPLVLIALIGILLFCVLILRNSRKSL